MSGTLYVVATPIGNTEDITARAKRILSGVDIIAAEDTRATQVLLRALDIHNKTVSNHKFNERHKTDFFLDALYSGKSVALVSDAGTPCVSDPGSLLVQAAAKQGIPIVGVCGASAVMAALSVCGFEFASFTFYGFLPRSAGEIKKALHAARQSTVDVAIYYESPKRIISTVSLLADETPKIQVCLCNDLTKLYERIYRGAPGDVLNELQENPYAKKGEYTLVLQFASALDSNDVSPDPSDIETDRDPISPEALLIDHMAKNGGTLKDAIQTLADRHCDGMNKNLLYKASLRLRQLTSIESRPAHALPPAP